IDETAGVGPFPVLSFDDSGGPFMFHELALVVNSVTVDAEEFELVVDNALNADRFFNRQTLKSVEATDRIVTLNTLIPHGDFTALYGAGGSAGVAATATFTNALNSAVLTFSMVKVALPRRPLEGTGRAEKMIRLNGIAYETAATKELV